MHELGHTLGLHHGGGDDINCKPNYPSVMNYTFQVPNLDPERPLDYSREQLPALYEFFLDESAGVGASSGHAVFGVNGAPSVVDATGPIDWNGDGGLKFGVNADINYILKADGNPLCSASPNETLYGQDDWSSLVYNFRLTQGFANGVADSPPATPPQELTADAALSAAEAADSDGDGVSNAAESVCNTMRGYVEGSTKYQNAKPQQRTSADARVDSACKTVGKISQSTNPAQKNGLIAAYKAKVDALRSDGWLTAGQATTLKEIGGIL
jgi:hypothetical protein